MVTNDGRKEHDADGVTVTSDGYTATAACSCGQTWTASDRTRALAIDKATDDRRAHQAAKLAAKEMTKDG